MYGSWFLHNFKSFKVWHERTTILWWPIKRQEGICSKSPPVFSLTNSQLNRLFSSRVYLEETDNRHATKGSLSCFLLPVFCPSLDIAAHVLPLWYSALPYLGQGAVGWNELWNQERKEIFPSSGKERFVGDRKLSNTLPFYTR